MKRWKIEGILTDDGIEDSDGEVEGKYFTKAEIKNDFVQVHYTAGLRFRITKITEIRPTKGGGSKAGARRKRK